MRIPLLDRLRSKADGRVPWKWPTPQAVFVTLSLSFGLLLLFANPPFQAADEWEHYFRAIQLSEGTIIGVRKGLQSGGDLPERVIGVTDTAGIPGHTERKVTLGYFRDKIDPPFCSWNGGPRVYTHFPHTVIYAPSGYLPQTIGVFMGKVLGIGPLGLFYVARLGSFIASLWLGYAALRCLPVFRWAAVLLLVGPLNLYLMGSAGPDGVLIGGAFLLTALLLRIATNKAHQIDWREKTVLLALAALLPTTKFVYLPLAALVPVIVVPRLRSAGERTRFGLSWAVFCLVPVWVWIQVMHSVYVPGRSDFPIDPTAQFHHMAAHPFSFLALVAKSMSADCSYVYRSFVGLLGWNDTPPPIWYLWVFGGGLLICLALEARQADVVRWPTRLAMLVTAGSTVLMVYFAQYASWNAPGSLNTIGGIVGRYFFPIVPCMVFSFPALPGMKVPVWCAPAGGIILGVLGASVCVWQIVSRYYLP